VDLHWLRNGQSWGASLGLPFPLLAQELLDLLHELLQVKVAVILWARHLVHRRILVLLSLPHKCYRRASTGVS
jgi:hypothetical protein